MIKEQYSDVTIVELPPLRVACFRATSRTPEDDALKVLTQWASGAGLSAPFRTFGFECEVTPEQSQAGLRSYELWFVVPDGVVGAGPVTIRVFPGGTFAALTLFEPFADPFERIPAGWDMLHEWAVSRGTVEPSPFPCLEEVVDHGGQTDMILYHPLP